MRYLTVVLCTVSDTAKNCSCLVVAERLSSVAFHKKLRISSKFGRSAWSSAQHISMSWYMSSGHSFGLKIDQFWREKFLGIFIRLFHENFISLWEGKKAKFDENSVKFRSLFESLAGQNCVYDLLVTHMRVRLTSLLENLPLRNFSENSGKIRGIFDSPCRHRKTRRQIWMRISCASRLQWHSTAKFQRNSRIVICT